MPFISCQGCELEPIKSVPRHPSHNHIIDYSAGHIAEFPFIRNVFRFCAANQ